MPKFPDLPSPDISSVSTAESINKPEKIPLTYWLAHLNIDPSDIYPKINAQQIAREAELEYIQVKRHIAHFQIEGEKLPMGPNNEVFTVYPHYAFELIKEEHEWRKWFYTLPQRLNTTQVAEAVGRSYGWTQNVLSEIYPNAVRQRHGKKSFMYPRTSVRKLRELTIATPPNQGWHTVGKLEELTGKSREWVENRLNYSPLKPEERRQLLTGRTHPHYPPDALDFLEEAAKQQPPAAGDWLTSSAIEDILHKSASWVARRLPKYLSLGEMRLDDMSVERFHYPTSVLEALYYEVKELQIIPEAGDWINISELVASLGKHAITLTKLMKHIEVDSETRLDRLGKPGVHYSPETQKRLAEKVLEVYGYPDAEGWLSFRHAQTYISKPATWVMEQLERYPNSSEMRLDRSGHAVLHYNPEVIEQIKVLGDSLNAGDMLSVKQITRAVGRSRLWIEARMESAPYKPEKRFTMYGHFTNHYPPEIVDYFKQIDNQK